ncbi:MAG: hypothetical protein A3F61_00740 [Candidatus Blackburnbacteria bacterium RIFCSPHIGHO2_12_FULL_41_13b]|uniref:Glycosyl transferase family 1 domain-containing protein n=1 Tax=Candidatus Blackburnbacteria bacterium RIFCSPHIGHO2_12_FULL_41_13b TaxID=1797517 RepID=A0A1G1VBU5_9BACT|nr:MAG: hypothetical protein A3F61_00740 [Candidatus Blackburnbacteria bacterium RIFCSPHIGHO2_12_FULL_41_13b]
MNKNIFNQKVKESSFLIAAHEDVKGGLTHTLRNFLLEKKPNKLLFIAHPLLYFKENYKKSSYFEFYTKGKLQKVNSAYRWWFPEQLLYIKDVIYTVFWAFKTNTKYDLVIALDPLNAFAGLLLKMFGRAKRVVHYSIDYFPTRFENQGMNWIYHQVDKFAVRYSDETWNLGARMAKAREEGNDMVGGEYKKRQHHVPIGVWMAKIKRKPIDRFDQKKLIYAGGFVPYMGIDLVIKTLPKILKKVPGVTLEIIGRGEAETEWKELAKKHKVDKHIIFRDWMENREAFHLKLSEAAIGLAPFNYNILDDKVKNADPGKIKDYTSSGLPVITTKAVYTWRDLQKSRCGIIVDYNEDALASAVVKLLKDRNLLLQFRKNAINYAKQFDWDRLFTENISRVIK